MAMVLQATRLRVTQAIYFGKPAASVGAGFLKRDGSTTLTNNWNAGNFEIDALTLRLPAQLTTLGGATPGGTSGIYAGVWTLVRFFQAAPGAGGQSNGNNVFVGGAGNFTMTNPTNAQEASDNVGVGVTALLSLTSGFDNTAVGQDCLYTNTTGYYNTAIGSNALGFNTIGNYNTALGMNTSFRQIDGHFNTTVGSLASWENLHGSQITAVGWSALHDNLVDSGTAVGFKALEKNTTGANNTAVGTIALAATTTGGSNTACGQAALTSNVLGSVNTAVGAASLLLNTNGSGNVGLGYAAGLYETASDSFYVNNQDRVNTAGDKALSLLYGTFAAASANQRLKVNGEFIVNGIGANPWTTDTWSRSAEISDGSVLKWVKGATYAFGIGQAGDYLHVLKSTADDASAAPTYAVSVSGAGNVGIGTGAAATRSLDVNGPQRLRGVAAPAVSEANSGVMYFDSGLNKYRVSMNGSAYVDLVGSGGVTGSGVAGKLTYWTAATNLTDEPNITLGGAYTLGITGDVSFTAGWTIREGAVPIISVNAGGTTLIGNSTPAGQGAGTTAIGAAALLASTAVDNTAVGGSAALNATIAAGLTAIGTGSLGSTTTGDNNTALGRAAGNGNTTGANNLFLGHSADAAAGNLSNAVAIGYQASVAASDSMSLGNASMKVGIHTSAPAQPLDVDGAVATRHKNIAVVNGLNSDIALTDASLIRLTGPTGGFSLGGFTGGTDGRLLRVINTTAQAMTIVNLDGSSAAANQITTLTGGNVVLAARTTAATFVYEDVSDTWVLFSFNG